MGQESSFPWNPPDRPPRASQKGDQGRPGGAGPGGDPQGPGLRCRSSQGCSRTRACRTGRVAEAALLGRVLRGNSRSVDFPLGAGLDRLSKRLASGVRADDLPVPRPSWPGRASGPQFGLISTQGRLRICSVLPTRVVWGRRRPGSPGPPGRQASVIRRPPGQGLGDFQHASGSGCSPSSSLPGRARHSQSPSGP